jgi:dephospho-CoA kinase
MRVFGLTGNIGSGKSTVAAMLREAGIPVLDADRISKEVTAPGGRAYDAVVRAFGKAIVRDDGTIDRKRLGEIVFSDPASRERLERITHPAILEAMKEAISGIEREGHRAAVVEATLIHESGKTGLFEAVISVACDRETAISRLAARDGMSRSQAEARLRAQMDADRKAEVSDYVIDTSGNLDETRRQVLALARVLLENGVTGSHPSGGGTASRTPSPPPRR